MAHHRSYQNHQPVYQRFGDTGDYNVCTYHSVRSEYVLGNGSFGYVFKGNKPDGSLVAAKKIPTLPPDPSAGQPQSAHGDLLPDTRNLSHPNVITILWVERTLSDLWVIMEYCKCTLLQYLSREVPPSSWQRECVCVQTTSALAYLHEQRIVHRDLKPDNVLVVDDNAPHPHVKVSDFGYAADLTSRGNSFMSTVRGNPYWLAPELLDHYGHLLPDHHRRYKMYVDVFSCGLVLMFTCLTLDGRRAMERVICGAEINRNSDYDVVAEFAQHWSDQSLEVLQTLIRSMTAKNPQDRPSTSAVLDSMRQLFPDEAQLVSENCEATRTNISVHEEPEYGSSPLAELCLEPQSTEYEPFDPQLTPNYPIKLATLDMRVNGEIFPGFSFDHNTLLIWRNGSQSIIKTNFKNGQFGERERFELPHSFKDFQYKHTMSSGKTYMTHKNEQNQMELGVYDEHLHLVSRYECEGVLLAAVDDKWLVFDNRHALARRDPRSSARESEIVVKSLADLNMVHHQLQIKCKYNKEDWPRGGGHPTNGKMAVVAREKEKLEVFDEHGNRLYEKDLEYRPGWLSCSEQHLFIPDINAPALNIYTWSGDLVRTYDNEALGLHSEDMLWDVSPVHEHIILAHFQVHNSNEHKFNAYQLEPQF